MSSSWSSYASAPSSSKSIFQGRRQCGRGTSFAFQCWWVHPCLSRWHWQWLVNDGVDDDDNNNDNSYDNDGSVDNDRDYDDYDDDDDNADYDYESSYIWEPELVHGQQDVHLTKCS